MKISKQGLCLALLGAGLSIVPVTLVNQASASPAESAPGEGLASQLRDQAQGLSLIHI